MDDESFKIRGGKIAHEDDESFKSTAKRRQFGYDYRWSYRPYKEARNYLGSRIGEAWNKVWADICDKNAPKDKINIFNYIRELMAEDRTSLVYINCFRKEDGGIYTIANRIGEIRVDKEINYGWRRRRQLYVYEGILRATIDEKVVRPKEIKVVKLNEQEFVQKDEIWYRVILKKIAPNRFAFNYGCYDTLRKRHISYGDGNRFYGREVYCFAHYPLKNKELRELKKHLKTIRE